VDIDESVRVEPFDPAQDGRFSIMMPHPERVFRANSWYPREWQEYGSMAAHVQECAEVGRVEG